MRASLRQLLAVLLIVGALGWFPTLSCAQSSSSKAKLEAQKRQQSRERGAKIVTYSLISVIGVLGGFGLFRWRSFARHYRALRDRKKDPWDVEPK